MTGLPSAGQGAALGPAGDALRLRGSNGAPGGAAPAPLGAAPRAPANPAPDPKPDPDDSGTDTEDEGELIRKAQQSRAVLDRFIVPGPARERAPALAGASAVAGGPPAPYGAGVPAYAPPKKRNANAGAPALPGICVAALCDSWCGGSSRLACWPTGGCAAQRATSWTNKDQALVPASGSCCTWC